MDFELAETENKVLKTPLCEIVKDTAASRVLEIVAEQKPELLMDIPFLLAICEVYYQRRLGKVTE